MRESEIEVSEDLVRDLLREQHPDLADRPIREVAGGWGNQMWRLGDDLAVRVQRMDPGPDLQAFLHATTSVKGFLHAAWRVA